MICHGNKQRQWLLVSVVFLLCALSSGCVRFEPTSSPDWPNPSQVKTAVEGDVHLSAAILTDQQAEAVYGVNLADVGLQATWLRVDNRSANARWLLVSAFDANYYAPDEAAALFYPILSNADDVRVTQHFRDLSIPLKTSSGTVTEGFVLAPRKEGGRYANFALFGDHGLLKFGFALPLPNGEFDYEQLDVHRIFDGRELRALSLAELRMMLEQELPCCSRNESGDREGDPLNLVMVGEPDAVLASLSAAGWSFTHKIDSHTVWRLISATLSGEAYPVAPISPLYVDDRPQDIAMQRARATIVQRNHLRLWLLPVLYQGEHVWIGQVSRDVGIKATTLSPTLTTHVIDPNVDEAREHLLQTLLLSGGVKRFGFVGGSRESEPERPAVNLTEDPYYSDGLRLYLELTGELNVPPAQVEYLEWEKSDAPMQRSRSSESP